MWQEVVMTHLSSSVLHSPHSDRAAKVKADFQLKANNHLFGMNALVAE